MHRARFVLGLALAVTATNCSWCSPPKVSETDDPSDLDAAPRDESTVHARCGDAPTTSIALPTTGDATFELGRVRAFKQRIVIGARRGARAGLLDVDGLTATFVETCDATGDAPPPLPIVTADHTIAIAYEGTGKTRHLVAREEASPATPLFALEPEAPDDSLAFDGVMLSDGSIVVAWDAPADEGSAIWARVFRAGKLGEPVRLSPKEVDADSPRLVAFGPALVAMWIAHRAIARDKDAAPELEGAGQDLDHAWIEMLAFETTTLGATSPLRHVTPDTGRITTFDVQADKASALPAMTVTARDGIELQAGQGGSALVVRVAGPDPAPPIVLSNHIGRGLPLFIESSGVLYFEDAAGQARTTTLDGGVAIESFTGERALLSLGDDMLFAPETKTTKQSLHIFRCKP